MAKCWQVNRHHRDPVTTGLTRTADRQQPHFLRALVEEYLRRFESEKPLAAEAALERGDQTAAQRLLAIFAPPQSTSPVPLRGCPFHNAAVEGAGELPQVARLAQRHKHAFRDRLVATAAEAGAADPESLGR